MKRALLATVVTGLLGGFAVACASQSAGGGHAEATGSTQIAGPAAFDCDKRRAEMRSGGHKFAPFFVELRCRVQPVWTCPSFCQGRDERFVSEVSARIDRAGQLVSSQTSTSSGSPDYDELSVAALRGGAPFAAPPPQLLDGTGVVPLNIEFSCDCRK